MDRCRAYELWKKTGKPPGLESEHWSYAAAEWDSRQQQATYSSWATANGISPSFGIYSRQ